MLDLHSPSIQKYSKTTPNECWCCSVTAGCVNKPLFAKQIHYINLKGDVKSMLGSQLVSAASKWPKQLPQVQDWDNTYLYSYKTTVDFKLIGCLSLIVVVCLQLNIKAPPLCPQGFPGDFGERGPPGPDGEPVCHTATGTHSHNT